MTANTRSGDPQNPPIIPVYLSTPFEDAPESFEPLEVNGTGTVEYADLWKREGYSLSLLEQEMHPRQLGVYLDDPDTPDDFDLAYKTRGGNFLHFSLNLWLRSLGELTPKNDLPIYASGGLRGNWSTGLLFSDSGTVNQRSVGAGLYDSGADLRVDKSYLFDLATVGGNLLSWDSVANRAVDSGIGSARIAQWDSAYSHSLIAGANPHGIDFNLLLSHPTTLAGYGITDVWTKTEADGRYLQGETDPVFSASAAYGISSGDIGNWNAAYGWGDHALAGYELASNLGTAAYRNITTSTTDTTSDRVLTTGSYNIGRTSISNVPYSSASDWAKPSGYMQFIRPGSYASPASGSYMHVTVIGKRDTGGGTCLIASEHSGTRVFHSVTSTSTEDPNWKEFLFLDVADSRYLTSEIDPVFTASPAFGITGTDITQWDTAYSWGDHSGLYVNKEGEGYNNTNADVTTGTQSFWMSNTGANRVSDFYTYLNIDPGSDGRRMFQLASYYGNDNRLYYRSKYDSTNSWLSWVRIIDGDVANSTFLRLDASNSPLTGTLLLGRQSSLQMRVGDSVSSSYEPYIDFYQNGNRNGYIQAKADDTFRVSADGQMVLASGWSGYSAIYAEKPIYITQSNGQLSYNNENSALTIDQNNQRMYFGLVPVENARRAYALAKHQDASGYGDYLCTFHIQPKDDGVSYRNYKGVAIGKDSDFNISVDYGLHVGPYAQFDSSVGIGGGLTVDGDFTLNGKVNDHLLINTTYRPNTDYKLSVFGKTYLTDHLYGSSARFSSSVFIDSYINADQFGISPEANLVSPNAQYNVLSLIPENYGAYFIMATKDDDDTPPAIWTITYNSYGAHVNKIIGSELYLFAVSGSHVIIKGGTTTYPGRVKYNLMKMFPM